MTKIEADDTYVFDDYPEDGKNRQSKQRLQAKETARVMVNHLRGFFKPGDDTADTFLQQHVTTKSQRVNLTGSSKYGRLVGEKALELTIAQTFASLISAHDWDNNDHYVVYLTGSYFLGIGKRALTTNQDPAFLLSFCQTLEDGLAIYRSTYLTGEDEVLDESINILNMNDPRKRATALQKIKQKRTPPTAL